MKLKYSVSLFILLLLTISSMAQVPQAIRYQAIARDAVGNVIPNKELVVKINIHDITEFGKILYSEKHAEKSNVYGLINLSIGRGEIIEGNFEKIPWGLGEKYIEIEIDFGNGFIR